MTLDICFVALGSYSLLKKSSEFQYIGGAELRQVILGEELAKKKEKITFITYGNPQEVEFIEDIRVIKSYNFQNAGFFTIIKKLYRLWHCLNKTGSKIFIHSSGCPGFVALYCLLKNKKFVLLIPSDTNVSLVGIERKTSVILKILLFLDIKLADLIIVQNQFQKETIERNFKKRCELIKNPIPIFKNNLLEKGKIHIEKYVLWVGTLRHVKRPELYVRLAEQFPQKQFVMIGVKDDNYTELYRSIINKSKQLKNFQFIENVPHNKMQSFYQDALLLINTSDSEGFPNTFLEAWVNSVPIISLNADPDEIICANKLGFHSKSFEQMVIDLNSLLQNEDLRQALGHNGRKYVERDHEVENITENFLQILLKKFTDEDSE